MEASGIFFSVRLSDTEIDKFTLIYQGGHHNIYCDGSRHLKTSGGFCHLDRKDAKTDMDSYLFSCDCDEWRCA